MSASINDIFEEQVNFVKTFIRDGESKSFVPSFICYTPDYGRIHIASPIASEEDKVHTLNNVATLIAATRATHYSVITESWVVKTEDSDPNISPSQSEKRTEVITILCVSREGEMAFRGYSIHRDKEGYIEDIELEPHLDYGVLPPENQDIGGDFSALMQIDPDSIPDDVRSEILAEFESSAKKMSHMMPASNQVH